MQATFVMTIIGADRPGLVELLSTCVTDHGGNWSESRLGLLDGQFAGLVRVTLPGDRVEAFLHSLGVLESHGLRVVAQLAHEVPDGPGVIVTLEISGRDRPGIVHALAVVLAEHQVNIRQFSSECVESSQGEAALFQARATVCVPPSSSLAAVRRDIERIAAELPLEIRFLAPE